MSNFLRHFNKLMLPCDPYNHQYEPYSGTATNCPETCPRAPCYFVVQFECYLYSPYPDGAPPREGVTVPGLLLKKDCVRGSTWSSRWVLGNGIDAVDEPLLGNMPPAGCLDELEGPINSPGCCCHWGDEDLYWGQYLNLFGCPETLRRSLDGEMRKWILTIANDGSATLVFMGRSGVSATYSASEIDCEERTTFVLTERSADLYGLPACVCVVALTTPEDETSCTGEAQECDCCLDYDCGLPFIVSVCGGNAEAVPMEYNGTLPCGVTDPEVACGYFWGTYDLGDNACDPADNLLGFLVYCTGNDAWTVKVYCYIDGCYVFQQDASLTGGCECAGIYFEMSFSAECICCGEACTDCDREWPETITATDGTNTIEMTLTDPDEPRYEQSSGLGGEFAGNFTQVYFYCGHGTGEWSMDFDSWNADPVPCGMDAAVVQISASCDPLEVVLQICGDDEEIYTITFSE